ncbi:MAG: hypothetical protein ACODTL_08160 [Brucella sp.]
MRGFKPADWGGEADELGNANGFPLFKRLVLNWSEPQVVGKGNKPYFEEPRACLYAIMRNHHGSHQKDRICYIGLSTNPSRRFYNHPTAIELIEKRGCTTFSHAYLDMEKSSKTEFTIKRALEDVEHILIWTVWQNLKNKSKQYTLPGMGSTTGDPYHIINEGYGFLGQMPKEIIYPWALVLNRKDKSWR